MKTVKEKLYNYEQMPPVDVWNNIKRQMGSGPSVVPINQARKKTRVIAFSTAAAAIIVILIINFVFVNKQERSNEPALNTAAAASTDSMKENYELLESIIKTPQNEKLVAIHNAEENKNLKYFTIEGPGGEPVKISPKVATLIVSADGEFPPKPVWNEKINHWQHIMLTNNVAPTSTNLIDIIQKASAAME